MKKSRLVIFTAHYPYTNGESFLEDELRIAETLFDRIIIVTAEKQPTPNVYFIPHNARVIETRSNKRQASFWWRLASTLLLPRVWGEIAHGCHTHGIRQFFSIARKTLLYESYITTLINNEFQWTYDSEYETSYYAYWLNSEAVYLARRKEILKGRCIARTHGDDCFFSRSYHPYRELQLISLDAIYPVSNAGKEDIIQHYAGITADIDRKIQVVHLGVCTAGIDDLNPWQYNAFVKTLVSCSNVIALKRLDMLVDAIAQLNININWVHFGDGDQMENIRQMADNKLSGKRNVNYRFMGRIPKSEIMNFYENNPVDLFVNCSDVEGIPVSVMEAMLYGIPAIARNVGGVSELVNGNCGLLLDENADADNLSKAIQQMLSIDYSEMVCLRSGASKQIRSHFCMEKNAAFIFQAK